MGQILEGTKSALMLLLSFDREIYGIVGLSLYVTLTASIISSFVAVPLGILLAVKDFPMKQFVVRFVYTMMSLPPVIVGLVIFLLFSRSGPLGVLRIIYTPTAMIVAQICLVMPIIIGIVYNGTKEKGREIQEVAETLGANKMQTLVLLIKELRINIFAAIVTGYGRAISEVGAVMIVGGNIRGDTRVMTTAIAMLKSQGDYETAIAIGIVLLLLSFLINSILYKLQQEES
ncbi:binding-protein-dependent transport systems inner membrane component [Alkaliphilus metalliredigens QYMF]|uniref:Binding-protein-dependent transport systems inner membrane component n=1 Tax=Alkaliphilus metalliredigens (strain QYMF) TaxID=293826 RepID=A6TM22_ALKMQ|nr:ABC transporter permease [Alkaliphilus metalliredigens]ABR47240.1 binding-protein-dependent transport systems inner membrane component [Alkaliphilus metalliredigens QYMF]